MTNRNATHEKRIRVGRGKSFETCDFGFITLSHAIRRLTFFGTLRILGSYSRLCCMYVFNVTGFRYAYRKAFEDSLGGAISTCFL